MTVDDPDSQLMNLLVRMVVPLRREFGRHLDVRQFLRNDDYAREVLDEALRSKDERLSEYARHVQTRIHGPRVASQAAVTVRQAEGTANAAGPSATTAVPPHADSAPAASTDPTAEEMRARIMKKYTNGLR